MLIHIRDARRPRLTFRLLRCMAVALCACLLAPALQAGLIIRITADPGGANQSVNEFHDDDPNDLDLLSGQMFLFQSVFDSSGTQLFDANLSVTTSSITAPFDFDLLADVISYTAGSMRVEVTLTDLDPTSFANGGLYNGDIGGTAGVINPGMTLNFASGYDTSNQPYAITTGVSPYNYPGGPAGDTFNYSASTAIAPLSGLFSISARYDFTATAALQDLGFDSFNDSSVPVPEPSFPAVLLLGTVAVVISRRKTRTRALSVLRVLSLRIRRRAAEVG